MVTMVLSLLVIGFVLWFFYRSSVVPTNKILFVMVLVLVITFSFFMRPEKSAIKNPIYSDYNTSLSYAKQMRKLEVELKRDPNNAELWYQIGQGYLFNSDLEEADLTFDYALRLTDEPVANYYAAKATTEYYLHSQIMSSTVQQLLNKALELDEYNPAALTLIASDHFISFHYQKAIDVWQKLLNSQRSGVDRVEIITSINRAKALLRESSTSINKSQQ